MKKLSLIITFLIFVGICFSQKDSSSLLETIKKTKDVGLIVHEERIGKEFPVSSFKTIDKELLSAAELRGKVIFINFWYKGCSPCMAEMKGLNHLYEKYNSENTVFIMITYENPNTIREVSKEYGLKYKMVSVPIEEISSWDVIFGYPSSFILDREGKIVYGRSGGKTEIEEATKAVLTYYGPVIESQVGIQK
ncbi:MAG: TlpA family protein disulfide reductase [Bacteroidales bacterium]|nr:TlpA family protein disulfide reductase [Bacteroidales bacterium]